MNLQIVKNAEIRNGFSLYDGDTNTSILHIDGNKVTDKTVPVAVLSIDSHVVYGLSHPSVVNKIFSDGPQPMITTKKISHTIFEHGMKSSLGSLVIGKTPIMTVMGTFYDVTQEYNINKDLSFVVVPYTKENNAYLKINYKGKEIIVTNNSSQPTEEKGKRLIELIKILDYVSLEDE